LDLAAEGALERSRADVQLHVRLSAEQRHQLEAEAARLSVPTSAILRFVVDRGLADMASAQESADATRPCTMAVGLAILLGLEEFRLVFDRLYQTYEKPEDLAIQAGANALRRLETAEASLKEGA
jgi:predicted DNA-binding protein